MDDLFNLEPENTGTEEWTPRNILLGNEAQQIYRTFHESHGDETIAAEGALNYAFSKLEEIPLRLAIVLSAFENPMVDEIDASTMVKAIELTNWFKREARRLYAELDPEKKIIDRILGVVEELGKATIRDVQRRIQSLKAFEIEKHINRLVNLNKLGHQDIETGGRPTRVYFLVHGNELSA